jgi:oligoribonuclease (3'-5' exoribonuclease)
MNDLQITKEGRSYQVIYKNQKFKSFASFCRNFHLDDTQICDKMRKCHSSREQITLDFLKKKGF